MNLSMYRRLVPLRQPLLRSLSTASRTLPPQYGRLRCPSLCAATGARRFCAVSAADLQFGQPVHETHPHLLQAGELTPGISAQEYADRRQALADLLPVGAVAVLPAASVQYRSGPVFYPFHQNSDFYYLTGFKEPEALAVIDKRSADYAFHLLVREKDEQEELWDGARSGTQAAEDVFNADQSGDIAHIRALFPKILDGATKLYTDIYPPTSPRTGLARYLCGSSSITDSSLALAIKSAQSRSGLKVSPLAELTSALRVRKSDAEIVNMRLAGKVSGRALTQAMAIEWEDERTLHAFLNYQFKIGGCGDEAYVPVVAGGRNALSIHYVKNDARIPNGDMVLVDAGGEFGGYITDITRTWPNSGRFSDAQRDLYSMILAVQRTSVALCRQDAHLSLDDIHRVTASGLKDGLKALGFDVSGDAIDTLFPHHVGHYVGLDVHDCPRASRTQKLAVGMCVTIEPGIYIPDDERWPAAFRGIGVRIEDSIAVQEETPLVLTTEAVKEVVDIEALRH